jgi:hypothetical protein
MPCPEECVEACMRSLLCAKCLEGLPGAATDVEQLSEGEPTPSTAARLLFHLVHQAVHHHTDANAVIICPPDIS